MTNTDEFANLDKLPEPSGDGWETHGQGEQVKLIAPGDYVEGKLESKGQADFDGTIVGRYVIETAAGRVVLLGSKILDERMAGIPTGYEVFVRLDGFTTTGRGNQLREFTVFARVPRRG